MPIIAAHTMDLVVLTKYGGDCVSITLKATPELFASADAFGSPLEPGKGGFLSCQHPKCNGFFTEGTVYPT